MTTPWTTTTWQDKPYTQLIEYPSEEKLTEAVNTLNGLPPLVTTTEIENLKSDLGKVAKGDYFLLQGGDCAESFADCNMEIITNKIKILLQMSLVLIHGLRKPVVRVGRIAGQYAKPRSSSTETRDGKTLPSFRGDLVNDIEFTETSRIPDPLRMVRGYHCSAITLNYIRALSKGGFADLHNPESWNLDFAKHSVMADQYLNIARSIRDALEFVEILPHIHHASFNGVDMFTSHEALNLWYEQPLTRFEPTTGRWYDLSTHFPWIGMRTAQLDGAHVEYFKGISNPVGVKVGPSATPEWVTELVETLNPHNEPGRLTLIHRFSAKQIASLLPPLIEAVQKTGISVVWSCDPMHGNTDITEQGIKTRRFDHILSELEQAFQIHHRCDSHLGGVHFEMTGDDVTECMGGARGLSEVDLHQAYKTLCDPRLNYDQALEMAMRIVVSDRRSG